MADHPQRRREDRFHRRVLAFFQRFLAIIGLAALICIVLIGITVSRFANFLPEPLPGRILLTYTFKQGLRETPGKPTLTQPLLRPPTTLHEVIGALQRAESDPRVQGFVARLQDVDYSTAQVQELRAAVHSFRKAGKFAWIFGEGFGGFSPGMGDYYLAAAFDEIWLQPVGLVSITGVAAEVPFVRDLLDKVGVLPQFGHKGRYKSGPESLTHSEMTAPNREAMESLVSDLFGQMAAGIAADRKFEEAAFRGHVNGAPYSDAEALSRRLVDRVGYYDELLEAAKAKAGVKDEKPVALLGYLFNVKTTELDMGVSGFAHQYLKKADPAAATRNRRKIALIYGAGAIVPYKSSSGTFGESGMSADKITEAFAIARDDEDVAAIVFRVDSPGGSPQASETIRRAVIQAQKKGKPVVVSMGGYAASGGYWVATPADKIVAQPGTITGSIGVFGGKLALSPLWEKIGVNFTGIAEGENARMWSPNKPFSEAEFARFDAALGATYEAFLQRVAEGRKITRAEAEAVAEGRVWTGRQAKEKKLVDELGGLDRAVEIAKELAKIDPKEKALVEQFPPPKSALEQFMSLAAEGALFTPQIDAAAMLRELSQAASGGALEQPAAIR